MHVFKSKLIWAIIVAVGAVVWYVQFRPQPVPEYTTVSARVDTLVQTVSATGSVQGSQELELSFEVPGVVDEVLVEKGAKIEPDQVIARIRDTRLASAVQNARAAVLAAEAELNKLNNGPTREKIVVAEQAVKQAQVVYDQRKNELTDLEYALVIDEQAYRDAVTNSQRELDSAVQNTIRTMQQELFDAQTAMNRLDTLLDNDSLSPILGALLAQSGQQADDAYIRATTAVTIAEAVVATALSTSKYDDIKTALSGVFEGLRAVAIAQEKMYTALVNTPPSNVYTSSALSAAQTNVVTDQATVSASIATIQTSQTAWETKISAVSTSQNNLNTFLAQQQSKRTTASAAVQTAQVVLASAEAELDLLITPARFEDIALAQSRLIQARAQLTQANAEYAQLELRAPRAGEITDVTVNAGETVAAGQTVVSLLGDAGIEIEVDIPESDIAKIVVGEPARVTLDAFGQDQVFDAVVVFVDPASTSIQDVVYYKVVVLFDDVPDNVRPGMTANIDIITAEKEQTIVIPARAVKQNGSKYVEVLVNQNVVKKNVTTGIRGDAGLIEIVDGLTAGEQVITFIKLPQ